jgi:hypothetical protein
MYRVMYFTAAESGCSTGSCKEASYGPLHGPQQDPTPTRTAILNVIKHAAVRTALHGHFVSVFSCVYFGFCLIKLLAFSYCFVYASVLKSFKF